MNTSPVFVQSQQFSDHESIHAQQSREAVREMESLFISVLLKEMRQAGGEGGLFPGDQSDTLGGMFDMYLGQHIAESGGIGLARSIETALN